MNVLNIITELKKIKVIPRLVNGNIKLVGETSNLSEDLFNTIRNNKEELISFLLASTNQISVDPIPKIAINEYYPLSNAQKRLWVLCQFRGGSEAYLILKSFYLKGVVDRANLTQAFLEVINRHESLRTFFEIVDNEPKQFIKEEISFEIEFEDISEISHKKKYLIDEVETASGWNFSLDIGPLLRVKLIKISDSDFAMIFGIHHIISDGWSIGILVQEVMLIYKSLCEKKSTTIAELKIHYKDYAAWLTEKINGGHGVNAIAFWRDQMHKIAEPLNLPTDYQRPLVRTYEGAVSKYYFSDVIFAQIAEFCKKKHITFFNFLRSGLQILLSKLSGQKVIVIGTPVSGRNHFDIENQIGLYVNTVPLIYEINYESSFRELVKDISENSYRSFEFQDYPFDNIIENLDVTRDTSRNPLFDILMVLQNNIINDGSLNLKNQHGFELGFLHDYLNIDGDYKEKSRPAKFDLVFNFDSDLNNDFYLEIEYSTQLFKESRIQQFYSSLIEVFCQVLKSPDIKIGNIEIVDAVERDLILNSFNRPIREINEFSILELLQDSFNINKDAVALIIDEKKFTYSELRSSSKLVASYLKNAGIPERKSNIGLLLDRTEWVIIGILGILELGLAYIPIDNEFPEERIAYIIDDADIGVLIVDDSGLAKIPKGYSGIVINAHELNKHDGQAFTSPQSDMREKLAYVIYTSGSTGDPKGIEICHRNTIAFLKWAKSEFANISFDVLYAVTSYCFDLSVFEIFYPLMAGKPIRLLNSALEIPRYINGDKNVMLNTVPSVVGNLLDLNINWNNVTALNMAGEIIPEKIKSELDFKSIEIRNLYGPSEATTYSTTYRFENDQHIKIPIGVPVDYSQLYILDESEHLLPIGVNGEIFLAGQLISPGYINRPILNEEKFRANPFLPGEKMYKTGDIGKWLPDGNVEFVGRIDDQVKIRGYRIELNEIQITIEKHPAVKQAIVVVEEINGDRQLLAYYTGTKDLTVDELKGQLDRSLPSYMIPGSFIHIESFPLNNNGKIDRKALPKPTHINEFINETVPARNSIDTEIIQIWEEILGKKGIGIKDDFFNLGGHSLKATRVISKIQEIYGIRIDLNNLFIDPTIEYLSDYIETIIWMRGEVDEDEAPGNDLVF